MSSPSRNGFTLIELSIVLVIIGLIIGGVLVGRDLIEAASIRSQISQIENYQTAFNTFRVKYGYLPGDISDPTASGFGFIARGTYPGQGDGNGIIEGSWNNSPGANSGMILIGGETGVSWRDLTTASLLQGGNNLRSSILCSPGCSGGAFTGSFSDYLPPAKLGNGNFVYVYSANGINYFGIFVPVTYNINQTITSSTGITPRQAYAIDSKMDDVLPQTGKITTSYVNAWVFQASANAAAASATTCFDTTSGSYSVGQAGGNSLNCNLLFRF